MSTSRRGDFLIPLVTVLSDCIAVEFAFMFSYWLRFHSGVFESLGFSPIPPPLIGQYLIGSLFVIAVWLMLFGTRHMYGARRNVDLSDELMNVTKVVSLGMLIVMSAAFFYREFSYSRIVFGLLWATAILAVFSGRLGLRTFERRLYRRGRHLQHAILVGNDSLAEQVYLRLHNHPSFGFVIAGYFADAPSTVPGLADATRLGTIADAPSYIRRHGIQLGFIALRAGDHRALLDLIGECEGVNIDFMMVPDLLEVLTSRVRVRELEGTPFLRVKSVPFTPWGRILKRAFDITLSSLVLLLLSPLWLLIAILIRLGSRGPILFRQRRIGLDGREFTMLKFRSMHAGAERTDDAAGLGLRNDPRRTGVGKLLRNTSLDELPQFLNVLRGEMSIVGPRPERVKYVEEFRDIVPKYLDRHRVKTGITGWAQVNGFRGDTSLEDRIRYDLYYIENWSLAFDVKIILRTLRAVLSFKEVD